MAGTITGLGILPPLREEVHCLPGPRQFDGSPSWTLHDPANNRFFRVGWLEFEMLTRWSLGTTQKIGAAIAAETTLQPSSDDVDSFARFLLANNLLFQSGEQAVSRFRQQARAGKQGMASWLLHNYLFFKIPLFKPDALLAWLYQRLAWIYSRWFGLVVLAITMTGIYLISRQWERFLNTFPHFFNWQGLSQYFLALILAKTLHEFGHALTAHRYGCRVPSMGVAFMVMYPMLYTDANETWKLNSRRQRLAIASAGIIAELGLAGFATLAWNFLDDGPLRSGVFLLATSTWVMTLLINLSPFMRFDGYYLLADFMKIENLQPRAFAYNRWHLRRLLFANDDPPPEALPANLDRFFVVYAWGTWLYRFFLFLGIAWMVYHFSFKLLGIVLMSVEIGWFIVKPIWGELKTWRAFFSLAQTRPTLFLLLAALATLAFVPWQRHLELPATVKPAHYSEIYLPYAARLQTLSAGHGTQVESGQLLAELTSNELLHQSHSAELEADMLSWQISYQGIDEKLIKQRQIRLKQLESANAKQSGAHRQLDQLRIQSPLAGTVLDINDRIQTGQWLKAGEALMIVADTTGFTVEAFVNEQDIMKILADAHAVFYPENPDLPPLSCRLQKIDDGSMANIPELLASNYGGPIAVRVDRQRKLIPETAQYRIQLKVEDRFVKTALSPAILRGTLKLETEQASLASDIWRRSLVAILKESEF